MEPMKTLSLVLVMFVTLDVMYVKMLPILHVVPVPHLMSLWMKLVLNVQFVMKIPDIIVIPIQTHVVYVILNVKIVKQMLMTA